MKKFIKMVMAILLANVLMLSASAKSNPYPKEEESLFGGKIINCTWYAWQQAKDKMGVELPLWTYVQTWYKKAEKAGYSVGKEPKPNSIMVWDYGEGFGGHVAYVTAVNGDVVSYTEGGSPMTESGINSDSMSLSDMKSFLVGFIYLDKVPEKVSGNKSSNNTKTEKKVENTNSTTKVVQEPKKEVKKSNNNYLKSLVISGIEFEFKKDVLEYNITTDKLQDNVSITATAEDEKANVTIDSSDNKIDEGINVFKITVKAEDSSVREYVVNVKAERNSDETEKKSDNNVEIEPELIRTEKKTYKMSTIAIVAVSASVAVLIIVAVIYRLACKNSKIKEKKC